MAVEVSLRPLDDGNWMQALEIEHDANQGEFIADADEILALAYVGRHRNSNVLTIYANEAMAGMLLVEDSFKEPGCYCLRELLIDRRHQKKGYATKALNLLLKQLSLERRFDCVQVGVHPANTAAIHVYQKVGFEMEGHLMPQDSGDLRMIYRFDR